MPPGDADQPDGPDGPDAPSDPEPRPEAAELCDPEAWGGESCPMEDGPDGTQYCIMVDGEEFTTPAPSKKRASACPVTASTWAAWATSATGDGEAFRWYSWSEPDCNTPLVLNFDDAPVQFTPASAASFDLSTDGTCMSTDWPTAPWLALDRDGDGFIRSGAELFGNATAMAAGGHAAHGFEALSELDSNRDGKITAADDRFSELVLWNDLDEDRVGAYAELRPLSETSLVAIDLGYERRAHCDGQGNCGYERASFEYRDAKGQLAVGEVVDVHVTCR